MRKVIIYIATSLDGYIARKNQDVGWLMGDSSEPNVDNGYLDFYQYIDTIIMGRKTYEQVLTFGDYPYKASRGYVFTSTKLENTPYVTFTNEHIPTFIKNLKSQTGKNIWVIGGASIIDDFIKNDLIDEYIVTVIPTILGDGIPLFKDKNPEIKLKLKETKNFDGCVQMHYIKR